MVGPTVHFLTMTSAIYAAVFVIGWWVRDAIGVRRIQRLDLPSGLFGLAALQVVAWYWATVVDRGLAELWPWFVAISIGLAIAQFVMRNREVGGLSPPARPAWPAIGTSLATGLGSLTLFTMHADELLARGILSIAADNNDVANYAVLAEFVDQYGASAPGWIAGTDIGAVSRYEVHGAVSYVSFAHWVVGGPYFEVMLAILAVASILFSQTCARLLRSTTSLSSPVLVLVALLPQSAYLFMYSARLYFLSQILGMLFAVAFAAIMFARRDSPRSWRDLVVGASLFAVLLLTYPQMAILTIPVVLAVVALHNRLDVRSTVREGLFVALCLGLAAVSIPTRTIAVVDRVLSLATINAGWVLDGVLPWQIAGFQRSVSDTVSPLAIGASAALLVASLVACRRLARDSDERWTLPAGWLWLVVLGSYAAYYFSRGGPSYQQWKLISFFQPLVIIGVFAPIAQVLSTRWREARGAAASAAFALLVILNMNAEKTTYINNVTNNYVSDTLGNLGAHPALANIDAVNVKLFPFWETMWAASALEPRRVHLLSQSYWDLSPPEAEWTLVRTVALPAAPTGQEQRQIGSTLTLIREPTGPTSLTSEADSTIEVALVSEAVSAEAPITGVVTVTNTGQSAWLSSGAGPGAVNIGVRELDDEGPVAEGTRLVLQEFPFSVAPGSMIAVPFELAALPPGTHRLAFETVSEQIAWFGTRAVVDISVSVG